MTQEDLKASLVASSLDHQHANCVSAGHDDECPHDHHKKKRDEETNGAVYMLEHLQPTATDKKDSTEKKDGKNDKVETGVISTNV